MQLTYPIPCESLLLPAAECPLAVAAECPLAVAAECPLAVAAELSSIESVPLHNQDHARTVFDLWE